MSEVDVNNAYARLVGKLQNKSSGRHGGPRYKPSPAPIKSVDAAQAKGKIYTKLQPL